MDGGVMKIRDFWMATCFLAVLLLTSVANALQAGADAVGENVQQFSLEQCKQQALENNRRRPASKYAVEMAEAQHRQALAGYWPQISAKAGYVKYDEPFNFLYPSQTVMLTQTLGFAVPEQKITLMDDETYSASLDGTWLLYDGGMRSGYSEQTAGLVDMMKEESRRTDLEIMDSVERLYWGAVLAERLHRVGSDTLARMEATLNLTETMYKEGSGRVKKTDWLSNKVMVETIRSMVALLKKNEQVSRVALANTMGLSWQSSVKPEDQDMPFTPFVGEIEGVIGTVYEFNPDWGKLEAGLRAAEGGLTTAKSGHYPKLAVTGKLYRWWNDYDGGLATEENEEGWAIGAGIELPLFSGMLTMNKIAEARARLRKLKEEKILLKEGLGVQLRSAFISLAAAEEAHDAARDAMQAAEENRDLNTRAYQNELVETADVITAQLMEAMMSAQYYKACYDHLALQSELHLVVGNAVMKKIQ